MRPDLRTIFSSPLVDVAIATPNLRNRPSTCVSGGSPARSRTRHCYVVWFSGESRHVYLVPTGLLLASSALALHAGAWRACPP